MKCEIIINSTVHQQTTINSPAAGFHFMHFISNSSIYAFHSMHFFLCISFYAFHPMHYILCISSHALYYIHFILSISRYAFYFFTIRILSIIYAECITIIVASMHSVQFALNLMHNPSVTYFSIMI